MSTFGLDTLLMGGIILVTLLYTRPVIALPSLGFVALTAGVLYKRER